MYKNGERAAIVFHSGGLMSQQTNAFAAVNDDITGRLQKFLGAPFDQWPPRWPSCQYRLPVAPAKERRRCKLTLDCPRIGHMSFRNKSAKKTYYGKAARYTETAFRTGNSRSLLYSSDFSVMLRAKGRTVQTKYSNFPAKPAALSQTR